jgi:succinate dehydrogenase / fumarate reductase cytochrome b subunit
MRERPLSPHLQVYRWSLSMALSILHRISGVALSAGAILLVWWLMAVAAGGDHYARFVTCVSSPLGQVALFGWTLAVVYHLLSGLRHLLWDTGWGFERERAQMTGWLVVVGTVVLTAVVWLLARGGV